MGLVDLVQGLSTRSKLLISSLALALAVYSCSGREVSSGCDSNSQCDEQVEMCLEGYCIEKTGCYSTEEDCPDIDRICYKEPGEIFGTCVDFESVDVVDTNIDDDVERNEILADNNSSDDCDPVFNTGCEEGESCKIIGIDEKMKCVEKGTQQYKEFCQAGIYCEEDPCFYCEEGICFDFGEGPQCEPNCYDDSHCPKNAARKII